MVALIIKIISISLSPSSQEGLKSTFMASWGRLQSKSSSLEKEDRRIERSIGTIDLIFLGI
jgi:hypothetical protein